MIARSTLASVESGREPPSPRLWAAIQRALPEWCATLEPAFEEARRNTRTTGFNGNTLSTLAGPFALEEARYVYTFREHRAPEEIVEVRRVRALKDGADSYVLRMKTDGPSSELDMEVLWGGRIDESAVRHTDGQTVFLNRLVFDRPLRRGEVYSFGLRSWIAKEESPPTDVCLRYTIPIAEASLHLNFLGPTPSRAWRFGPLADAAFAKDPEVARDGLIGIDGGAVSAYFVRPNLNAEYGLAWDW